MMVTPEQVNDWMIGLDDTFRFKCRECGKCCKNREDIILTPRDLYNIANKLGKTTLEVINEFCDRYIGHSSRLPIVRLKPIGPRKVCPFLQNDRCMVHDVKPVVCALFPIGRVQMVSTETGGAIEPGQPMRTGYILQPITCGSTNRKQTVRSWLERFGIPVEDEFYMRWNETIFFLTTHIQKLEEKLPEPILCILWTAIFELLYVSYDTTRELLPQFEGNKQKLKNLVLDLESHINQRGQKTEADHGKEE